MKKPKRKRVVGIDWVGPSLNVVYFYTSEVVAECAKQFGEVRSAGYANKWGLTVDRRYDFEDVVAWLESFNL